MKVNVFLQEILLTIIASSLLDSNVHFNDAEAT